MVEHVKVICTTQKLHTIVPCERGTKVTIRWYGTHPGFIYQHQYEGSEYGKINGDYSNPSISYPRIHGRELFTIPPLPGYQHVEYYLEWIISHIKLKLYQGGTEVLTVSWNN